VRGYGPSIVRCPLTRIAFAIRPLPAGERWRTAANGFQLKSYQSLIPVRTPAASRRCSRATTSAFTAVRVASSAAFEQARVPWRGGRLARRCSPTVRLVLAGDVRLDIREACGITPPAAPLAVGNSRSETHQHRGALYIFVTAALRPATTASVDILHPAPCTRRPVYLPFRPRSGRCDNAAMPSAGHRRTPRAGPMQEHDGDGLPPTLLAGNRNPSCPIRISVSFPQQKRLSPRPSRAPSWKSSHRSSA